ncbi:HAD-IIA family hydrolase [Salibacterium salarium]|uniref:Acid sugar phosphatase n=1 Tax=Salibacterium salarium TaxID=284579 RepID=A0A428N8Y5_9BACI|nr:HAD-IIA family hydrolase [Salibacterium salarium]RSL34864.1 HAD-IIA family hydrolase [Salibacterium salarium]
MKNLEEIKGVLMDIDGTVFRGNHLIKGAKEVIEELRTNGKKILFFSNRGNISRRMATDKLMKAGISVEKEEIILSSYVAAQFLRTNYPTKSAWVLGEIGLIEELEEAEVQIAKKPTEADLLVVSLHEHLTYADLNDAFKAVRAGARIIATNSDKSFPAETGEAIDVGGILGAIESATNRRADVVVGKPSHFMVDEAMKQLRLEPEKCVIIGDSLGSDMAMGELFGFTTALVLTGGTNREQAESYSGRLDFILPSIASLCNTDLKEEM